MTRPARRADELWAPFPCGFCAIPRGRTPCTPSRRPDHRRERERGGAVCNRLASAALGLAQLPSTRGQLVVRQRVACDRWPVGAVRLLRIFLAGTRSECRRPCSDVGSRVGASCLLLRRPSSSSYAPPPIVRYSYSPLLLHHPHRRTVAALVRNRLDAPSTIRSMTSSNHHDHRHPTRRRRRVLRLLTSAFNERGGAAIARPRAHPPCRRVHVCATTHAAFWHIGHLAGSIPIGRHSTTRPPHSARATARLVHSGRPMEGGSAPGRRWVFVK